MQCLMQMGFTKTKNAYFVVWTTHGMVKGNITLDEKLWESMKSNFEIFYKDFVLNSFFFQSKGYYDLMYWTVVYSSGQVLCKKKTFLRKKKNACKHINRRVSFVLIFLLRKPFYCHCSQTVFSPFEKSWKKILKLLNQILKFF